MAEHKKQLAVNDKEIALIKATFADNESLLKSLRALFLGLEVTKENKDNIKAIFAHTELRRLMYKRFLPTIDNDASIGQIQDVWLGVETLVSGAAPISIYQAIQSKAEAIEMVRQALSLLENPYAQAPNIAYTATLDTVNGIQNITGVRLLARNSFVRLVETQLTFFYLIAGQKEETTEAAKKRLTQDTTE